MTVPPVFVGSFRSGTTLLMNLLGLHPALTPWFETKAFCEALRWLRVLNEPSAIPFESGLINPREPTGFNVQSVAARMLSDIRTTSARLDGSQPSGKLAHERYPMGCDRLLYTLAEAEEALNRWLETARRVPTIEGVALATGRLIRGLGDRHAQRAGVPLWINKTPEIPRFAVELRQCLGPCRIVLLIRDGRQVVRSGNELGWAGVGELALWWRVLIEETRTAAAADPSHYLEIRYEDLVRQPAIELDRLLLFLDVEPIGMRIVTEYLQRLGRDTLNHEPQRTSMTLTPEAENAFASIAGDLMRELGYE